MEPNDTRLTSYFHHHQQQPQPPPPPPPQPQPHHQTQNPVAATAASPSNGLLPPSERPLWVPSLGAFGGYVPAGDREEEEGEA
ncbi:hypothetical protein CK203_042866 [Vitis vinifera]|uniref:Uncharacterized protein n=1 Tax=Vitis vinifera TaxID=29760 RepID=A0A438HUL7_VITVI|nr:hypothetical protein CK203_042866 [Vitis vinifera]